MTTETLTPQPGGAFPPISSPPTRRRFEQSALYRYIVFPIGQMLVFIVGAVVVLTIIAYLVAFLFPEPRPNIFLYEQLNRQLPGMIISGISLGFIYAMIALGYTLVYGVLKFINFAHSEVFMVGSIAAFGILSVIGSFGALDGWSPVTLVIVTVLFSALLSGLLSVFIERVAYKPLRKAPRLVPLITAIGISFILQDVVRALSSLILHDFNLTYPTRDLSWIQNPLFTLLIGENEVRVRTTSVIIIVASIIMLLLLNYFVNGTKAGRGIRAISMDQTTAGLMGIPVNLMISLTFFIGGAFGGTAGALYGLNVGTVTPYIGFAPGLKGFTAAVLGGIGNITGALLGGIMIGMIEAYLNGILTYFPAIGGRYTDIITFGILIAVLIFRPSGLLGERVDEKV